MGSENVYKRQSASARPGRSAGALVGTCRSAGAHQICQDGPSHLCKVFYRLRSEVWKTSVLSVVPVERSLADRGVHLESSMISPHRTHRCAMPPQTSQVLYFTVLATFEEPSRTLAMVAFDVRGGHPTPRRVLRRTSKNMPVRADLRKLSIERGITAESTCARARPGIDREHRAAPR